MLKRLYSHIKQYPIYYALGIILLLYYIFYNFFLYCNDAYVKGSVIPITPKIDGYLIQVAVKDNQWVHKGELLATIDPRPFQLAVAEKKALLAAQQQQLQASILRARATLNELESLTAQFKLAALTLKRYRYLEQTKTITLALRDKAQSQYEVLAAQLTKQNLLIAESNQTVKQQEAATHSAKIQLEKALYELSLTQLYAPENGFINNLNSRPGDYVIRNTPFFGLVAEKPWQIIANYQGHYLAHIRVGDPVLIYLPTYPLHLFRGRVLSLSHAVAHFKENSNPALPYIEPVTDWIRYPYRFPVRIEFLSTLPKEAWFMGMDADVLIL